MKTMMVYLLKNKLYPIIIGFLILIGFVLPMINPIEAASIPNFDTDFSTQLTKDGWVLPGSRFGVDKNSGLSENIKNIFYPRSETNQGELSIYNVIRNLTLGIMIIFFVRAGASLLLNKKPEDARKHLYSLLYIILGGVFVYGANRLFGEVFNFGRVGDAFTDGESGTGLGGFTNSLIGKVFFLVLSAMKAAAFFLAIIMTVITGFRVMAAGEGEKGKKLVKGLINVVVSLLIIKGIDFLYYLTADSSNFVANAADFIINVAKVFGRIYGVITVIMVIVAGYLYITDGGSGSNFKKASNILINILLSALVLFGFLLITYQIFAEFQEGGDAVENTETALLYLTKFYV